MQTKLDKSMLSDNLEGSSSDGDEMFLDKEISLGQDQIAKNGFPLGKEEEQMFTVHPQHVAYRRQSHNNNDYKFSDFGA